jgi:KaiC/GvpD/RAD55 family RecA-like ATPase
MIRLSNLKLEMKVIKTLTTVKDQRSVGKLLASLEDCFFHQAPKLAFARIKTMLRERAIMLTYDDLIADPVLDENVRRRLEHSEVKALTHDRIDNAIRLLNKYRSLRVVGDISNYILDTMENAESLDVDKITEELAKRLVSARNKGDIDSWFTNIGGDDKTDWEVVRKALDPTISRFIPTGFRTWDSVNQGLPRARMSILSSTSGAGKSILARQLAHNIASVGGRVCTTSLEMDAEEMMQRNLSSWSKTSMMKVSNAKTLSKADREALIESFKDARKQYRKSGGINTLFEPQEDLSIEEILFALKPFGFDVIIIDYVGLLRGIGGDDQWKALQAVTRFCHQFAKNNDCHVCLVAQLNDDGSLALSKGMKRDASLMWHWSITEKERESGIAMIVTDKARKQKMLNFPLRFIWDQLSVEDLSEEELNAFHEERRARKRKRETESSVKNAEKTKKTERGSSKRRDSSGYFDVEE